MYITHLRGWLLGKIFAWMEIQPGRVGWKKPRLHEIFQPGLKLKSEVNPGRNLSVAFVVLVICIFFRVSIIFSARVEIFSCDYTGVFIPVNLAEIFSPGSSKRAETSSRNPELRFTSILSESRPGILALAENLHVIGLWDFNLVHNLPLLSWQMLYNGSWFGYLHWIFLEYLDLGIFNTIGLPSPKGCIR